MSSTLLSEAEFRMGVEFIKAGHTSLADPTPDGLHPYHKLFLDTQSLLKQYCRWFKDDKARLTLEHSRAGLRSRLLKLKDVLDKVNCVGLEIHFQTGLPSNAELLALRFATLEESDNVEIVELLTALSMLHLWHIPLHPDTEAETPEATEDAEDSSTEDTPTESDSNLETALMVELAEADRKIKAMQDAKNDLKSKLAMVEKAEIAVLQARDAMTQTQNAMAKADLAILRSPMSFWAEDN